MSFEQILEMVFALDGVQAVLFLDSTGETICSFGGQDPEKLQLVGAYQGILLNAISRIGMVRNQMIITLGERQSILTRHVKDGYFVCILFSPETHFALTNFRIRDACESLAREL